MIFVNLCKQTTVAAVADKGPILKPAFVEEMNNFEVIIISKTYINTNSII